MFHLVQQVDVDSKCIVKYPVMGDTEKSLCIEAFKRELARIIEKYNSSNSITALHLFSESFEYVIIAQTKNHDFIIQVKEWIENWSDIEEQAYKVGLGLK